MNNANTLSCTLTMLMMSAACNSADFGSSNANKSPATTTECAEDEPNCDPNQPGPSTPNSEPTGNDDCVDGEKLKIEWTGEVRECLLDQGKTYNFDLKKCAAMRQATFECNWSNVTSELEDRSLLTETLKNDSKSGAKLVSCGQSEDGNRIVVQWVSLPTGETIDCKRASAGASITTGCYTLYKSGDDRPAEAKNEVERAQQVFDCMNKL